MLADAIFRLRALFRRDKVETELDDEIRSHVDALVRKYLDGGCTPEEAERRARLAFGGIEQIKDACRDARGVTLVETLARDVRHGVRLWRRDPAVTTIAVLTLALGIGASAAAFSVVHAILLKPLPYPDAGRIVFPWLQPPQGVDVGFDELSWGRRPFIDFARQTRTFEHVGAFLGGDFNLTGRGDPVRLPGLLVSEGFLPSLGVQPALGRAFTRDEDRPGHGHVVILSDRLWRERFGAEESILGTAVELNGALYTIVGVMPPAFAFPRGVPMPAAFAFPREASLWVPLGLSEEPPQRGEPSELAVVGRLARGVTITQAQAELDLFAREMDRQYPRAKGWFNARAKPLAQQVSGDARRPVLLLFGAVGVVLLIACSNVANLLLMRAMTRAREFRLRAALGAGRGQLVRQLLAESLLLSLTGGAAGILLARAAVALVRTVGPAGIPRLSEIGVDVPVLAFSVGLSVVTGLLFGLAPAVGATGDGLAVSLRDGRGGTARGSRLHRGLLVSEVALALVLVVASGLLVRTFVHLLRADAGFDAGHVLTFELTLPPSKYTDLAQIVRLYQRTLERLRAVPGVRSAGVAETVPMGGAGETTGVRIPEWRRVDGQSPPFAKYTIASPGYFAAVGTPILRGRGFLDTDTADSRPVAIVSAAMARKYWPGQDVIGRALSLPIYSFDMTIVGVAADVKHQSFSEDPGPEMYVPLTQKPWPSMATMHVVLRTDGDPALVTAQARAAVRAMDPDLPIANVETLDQMAGDAMVRPRFAMLLLSAFGAMALALACVGLYGAVSASVTRRTREIGVRMALGAPTRRVFAMVVGEGARVAASGIVIGVVVSLAVLRTMAGFLYGVAATDPATFVAVSALLFAVALLACYVPARRATRVDPTTALRCE
ncbi:MAG: ADOP family duplicated permease [Betaproteobacteria bacterium]